MINLLNILEFKTPAMRKLIVVTGGSSGIGRAIIHKFVKEGFDAITCARTEKDLAALKKEVEAKHPEATVYYLATDMSSRPEVARFIAHIDSLKRVPDVLVNNAGYFVPGEIIGEDEENLEKMINANLYSAYHTTRGLVPEMIRNRAGHVFNMCSIASFQAYKNGGSYAISKFALLGFSKCLREEVKEHGIRVTAVMPGATLTRSWEGSGLPEERFMRPEYVADSVFAAWSLSPQSVVEEIVIRPQLGDV